MHTYEYDKIAAASNILPFNLYFLCEYAKVYFLCYMKKIKASEPFFMVLVVTGLDTNT